MFTFSTDSCGDFARRVKRRRMVAKLGDPKGTAKFAPKNPYRPTPEEARANGRKGAAARWARRAAQLAAAAAPE